MSVNSRQPIWISSREDSSLEAEGVTSRKLPLPAGLGKILPSISQNALRVPYSVSSGAESSTGLLGYISLNNLGTDSFRAGRKQAGVLRSNLQTYSDGVIYLLHCGFIEMPESFLKTAFVNRE
jgi:hypothetical protein